MPKVSVKFQRRIADLDAQYIVAQSKRPRRILTSILAVIILAIIAVAAFSSANRTSSDFYRLTNMVLRLPCGEQPQPDSNAASEVVDTLRSAALSELRRLHHSKSYGGAS